MSHGQLPAGENSPVRDVDPRPDPWRMTREVSDDDRIYNNPHPTPPSRHGSDGGGNRVPKNFFGVPRDGSMRCRNYVSGWIACSSFSGAACPSSRLEGFRRAAPIRHRDGSGALARCGRLLSRSAPGAFGLGLGSVALPAPISGRHSGRSGCRLCGGAARKLRALWLASWAAGVGDSSVRGRRRRGVRPALCALALA